MIYSAGTGTPAFPLPHPCSLVYNPQPEKHVLLMIPLGRKQPPSLPWTTKNLQMPQKSLFHVPWGNHHKDSSGGHPQEMC